MRQSKKDAIRLNKLISDAGFCSRREADEYIAQERVTVNSHTAKVGDLAFKTDFIRIDGEPLRFVEKVVEQKRKPEFLSKRVSRNTADGSKKERPVKAEAGKNEKFAEKKKSSNADSIKKDASSASAPSKSSPSKPDKKTGSAKKWFSGRKK
ncbi:S4 domain-containing protein [uncultured Acetobacteroides sp.]|uniref:S4 domain-containing protein n=1 Tax=uncultured Acetobacteroides sp. TaxID=1760811 RepID=UPI0029F5B789|nr:S4 domain-containing protein [uncultured Acetobacteroides sp.]